MRAKISKLAGLAIALLLAACAAMGPLADYTRDVAATPDAVYEALKGMDTRVSGGIATDVFRSLPNTEVEGEPGKWIRWISRSNGQMAMTTMVTLTDIGKDGKPGTRITASVEHGVEPATPASLMMNPGGAEDYMRKALDAQVAVLNGNPAEIIRTAREAQAAGSALTMAQVVANPMAMGMDAARFEREERAASAQAEREREQNPPSSAPSSYYSASSSSSSGSMGSSGGAGTPMIRPGQPMTGPSTHY